LLEIFFNPPKEKELTRAGAKIFSKVKRGFCFMKKVAGLGVSSSDLTSQRGRQGLPPVLSPLPDPKAISLGRIL
jgi:hypothetical protein